MLIQGKKEISAVTHTHINIHQLLLQVYLFSKYLLNTYYVSCMYHVGLQIHSMNETDMFVKDSGHDSFC